jgi:hypothetical protein
VTAILAPHPAERGSTKAPPWSSGRYRPSTSTSSPQPSPSSGPTSPAAQPASRNPGSRARTKPTAMSYHQRRARYG